MALRSLVPDSAMTAELLGTERNSHAVQISADGLLLTVGYSVIEANEIWLTNRKGQTSEAIILAQDYDSGIALLKPASPIGLHFFETATNHILKAGEELFIAASEEEELVPVTLNSVGEYSGRWEYLLERALFTLPLYERWSGAALLNSQGQLCGIGSLALGMQNSEGYIEPGNMFIPVDLVTPHLHFLQSHGKKPGQLRPWLGTLIEEHNAEIFIVGIYHGAPAALAGVRPGDIIKAVNGIPVTSVADFLRTMWRQSTAGEEIPLLLSNGKDSREVILESTDRNSFFVQHAASLLN